MMADERGMAYGARMPDCAKHMKHMMMRLSPNTPIRSILCLGAHSDDIEIGCGGAMLRLIAENPGVAVRWVVFSASPAREAEARDSAKGFLDEVENKEVIIRQFRDGFFPFEGGQIKEFFEELKVGFSPDVIFTHTRDDLHQDHRTLAQLTWNTFRNHLVLEYEIPKYEADLGHPNFFVPIDDATCQRKIDILMRAFPSQANKNWFTEDTFRALLRLRGTRVASDAPAKAPAKPGPTVEIVLTRA